MIEQAEQNTDESIDILSADSGYSTADNLQKLEAYDIDAYIPDDIYQGRSRGNKVGPFDKEHFIYDESADVFTCPAGRVLNYWHTRRQSKSVYRIYLCKQCDSCHHFGQCTTSKKGRSIWRRLVDKKIKAMRSKLDSESTPFQWTPRKAQCIWA